MLTLFKPWRSDIDLKIKNYSWNETFDTHVFTLRQVEIMKFFNIRYECNDARDDHYKLLKQGEISGGTFPQWMTADTMHAIDNIDLHDQSGDFADGQYEDKDYGPGAYAGLGKYGNS